MEYIGTILMIVIIIAMFVFMNRKQKKQDQETQNMRNSLRIGDEVTTIGGVVGRIVGVREETVVIETSRDGTKIRFLKSAIAKVDVTAEDAQAAKDKPAKKDEAPKEEKKEERGFGFFRKKDKKEKEPKVKKEKLKDEDKKERNKKYDKKDRK